MQLLGYFEVFFKVGVLKGTLSGLKKLLAIEKEIEKCFLFHLKSSFRSQDISIFVLSFWSCRNTTWWERSG